MGAGRAMRPSRLLVEVRSLSDREGFSGGIDGLQEENERGAVAGVGKHIDAVGPRSAVSAVFEHVIESQCRPIVKIWTERRDSQ